MIPTGKLLDRVSCDAAVTIVQLIHRRAAYWTQSNDYEFSRYIDGRALGGGRRTTSSARSVIRPGRAATGRKKA